MRQVVFDAHSTETDLPQFVVVELPDYTGPAFPKWKNDVSKRHWVPIPVYIATMTNDSRLQSRSARHQIPISLTRALTTHKAQGMSLDKIYIRLTATSARGTTRLYNAPGQIYTALSRISEDPHRNLLIEKFDAELLQSIADSDAIQAMKVEFVQLVKKQRETEKWVKPLQTQFYKLYKKKKHTRKTQSHTTGLCMHDVSYQLSNISRHRWLKNMLNMYPQLCYISVTTSVTIPVVA